MEFVGHKTKRELLRARDWESGWIAGEYMGRNRTLVTPTREEREVIYLRETLTTPEAYMKRMFAAGFDQARGVPRSGTTGGQGMRSGWGRGKDNLLRRIVWRLWAMRSWDTRCVMTSASARGFGGGRGMRSCGIL